MMDNPTSIKIAFDGFFKRHEEVNRWYRSTEVSYRLAKMLIHGRDGSIKVETLFPKNWTRSDVLKQYKGRFCEGGRASRATIADFKKDLFEDWESLLESVIVKEVGALEMFLREWTLAVVEETIRSQDSSLTSDAKENLLEMSETLQSSPQHSVSLERISELFPTLSAALDSTTHLRAVRPLLSPASGELSCRSVTGLWRAVRNLILHHDRIVHSEFEQKYAQLWLNMQEEARQRGRLIIPRICRVGAPLPIVARHVVFCLTTCYQTAVVLHVAAGGGQSAQHT